MKRPHARLTSYIDGWSATVSPRLLGLVVATALLSGCPDGKQDERDAALAHNGAESKSSAYAAIGASPTHEGAAIAASGKAAANLILPIEVLSAGSPTAPIVREANIGVAPENLAKVAQFWFQCHRCGYYAAPEFEKTVSKLPKIKVSMRVLGGATTPEQNNAIPWIDLTDSQVVLDTPERLQGGINGGFYTTKITLPLTAQIKSTLVALPKYNRVQFRFNGTDGETNGFRILQLQLRDAAAKDVGQNTIAYTDPKIEKDAGSVSTPDAEAGRALWYAENSLAKSTVVPRKIQASCSGCHAQDGRDLQYFNYSNNSIVQRSRFHGLSEAQGKQIAAYIRYSQRTLPHVAQARPWNPPYQPGPGLDAKPLNEWAAGAGLDAVLTSAQEQMNSMLGKPLATAMSAVTQADIDKVMDAKATMNVREMPVNLQFPDWNAWLPSIHPLDVWPVGANTEGSFKNGATLPNGFKHPAAQHKKVADWLTAKKSATFGDWSHLSANDRNQAKHEFFLLGWDAYNFLGGGRGDHINHNGAPYGAQLGAANLKRLADDATIQASGQPGAFTDAAFIERAVSGMLHWNTVNQWYLTQAYGLEGNQKWFFGDIENGVWVGRGEARGWPFRTVGPFFLAPHMLYQRDNNLPNGQWRDWYFAWEANNITASYYKSNQWYQAQMTINSGAQDDWSNFTMDWPYLFAFDNLIGDIVGTSTPAHADIKIAHYIRLIQGRIKGAQYVMNKVPLNKPNPAAPDELFQNKGRDSRANAAKQFQPRNYMDNGTGQTPYRALNTLAPGLHLKVINGSIRMYLSAYDEVPAASWRRCDPNNYSMGGEAEPVHGMSFCLDRTRTPLLRDPNGNYYLGAGNTTLYQANQYGLMTARNMGADAQRIQAWEAWQNRMWPQ